MTHRIVILGGGTGGTLLANRLARRFGERRRSRSSTATTSTSTSRGFCSFHSGSPSPRRSSGSRHAQLHAGIDFRLAEVESVDLAENTVHLVDGSDIAIRRAGDRHRRVAAAAGDRGPAGSRVGALDPHLLLAPGRKRPAARAGRLRRGSPRGQRDRHADQVPGGPAGVLLPRRLASARARPARGRRAHARHAAGRSIHEAGRLRAPRTRCSPSAASASSPSLRPGASTRLPGGCTAGTSARSTTTCWSRSPCTAAPSTSHAPQGLGDALGFVPADPHTLQSKAAPNVFAIGDAADVPTSKAGSVTHFEGETVVENIQRLLDGDELTGLHMTAMRTASSRPAFTRHC